MGTLSKGILGGFSGKVGPVVGANWKGIDVVRSMPVKRRGSSSVAQLDRQLRFAAGMKFLQPFTELVRVTFKNYAIAETAFNVAFSGILKEAIAGKSPDYDVDYSKARLSKGSLPNATSPAATATGNNVYFTWTDNSGISTASATDNAVMVVYCKDLNTAICSWQGVQRSVGAGQLDVSSLAGQTVETWLAFLTADGRDASDSIYTGKLTVQ